MYNNNDGKERIESSPRIDVEHPAKSPHFVDVYFSQRLNSATLPNLWILNPKTPHNPGTQLPLDPASKHPLLKPPGPVPGAAPALLHPSPGEEA